MCLTHFGVTREGVLKGRNVECRYRDRLGGGGDILERGNSVSKYRREKNAVVHKVLLE